jgi:hypothetical protein
VDCRFGRDVEFKGGGGNLRSSWTGRTWGPALGARRVSSRRGGERKPYRWPDETDHFVSAFVTLGSLINFCDAFLSAGPAAGTTARWAVPTFTSNYTPHQGQGKPPSLLGDVPRGVMLRSPRSFSGDRGDGRTGRIGFGTVIAAMDASGGRTAGGGDCPEGEAADRRGAFRPSAAAFHPGPLWGHSQEGNQKRPLLCEPFGVEAVVRTRAILISRRSGDGGRPLSRSEGGPGTALAERLSQIQGLAEKMERSLELAEKVIAA